MVAIGQEVNASRKAKPIAQLPPERLPRGEFVSVLNKSGEYKG
jgi:hypothetical protein